MAESTSQALSRYASLALFAFSLLVMTTILSAPQAKAQTPEGTVGIVPAISTVAAQEGPFTVFIVLEGLEHYGTLPYDDDRDTVPDREVESIGLAAFEFTIAYDPAVLALAGVERGPDLERTGRTFQCLPPLDEPGSLSFGCLSTGSEPPGSQGTLTLASVTLGPVGRGSSPLLLEAGLAGPLGDGVPISVSSGVARIMGSPVATATGAFPSGDAPTASPQPGGRSTGTPSPARTTQTPTASAAPGDSQTPEARTTAAAGDSGNSKEVTVRERDIEAENGGSSSTGGRSLSSAALWSVTALGSLTAAGALGLAAILWQRRKHRSAS